MAAIISPELMAQALTVGIVAAWGVTSKLSLSDMVIWHFFPVIAQNNPTVMPGPYSTQAYLVMAGYLLFWAYASFCYLQRAADVERRNSAAKRYQHIILAVGSAIAIQGLPTYMKFPGIMREVARLRPVRGRSWTEFTEQTTQLSLGISSALLYTSPAIALATDVLEGIIRIPGIGQGQQQHWRVPFRSLVKTAMKLSLAFLLLILYCTYAEVGFGRMLVAWLVALWLKPSQEELLQSREKFFGPGTVYSYLLATFQLAFCIWGSYLMGQQAPNTGTIRKSWFINILLGLGFQFVNPLRPRTVVKRISDLVSSQGATAVALADVSEREVDALAVLFVVFPVMVYSVASDMIDRLERWLKADKRD